MNIIFKIRNKKASGILEKEMLILSKGFKINIASKHLPINNQ